MALVGKMFGSRSLCTVLVARSVRLDLEPNISNRPFHSVNKLMLLWGRVSNLLYTAISDIIKWNKIDRYDTRGKIEEHKRVLFSWTSKTMALHLPTTSSLKTVWVEFKRNWPEATEQAFQEALYTAIRFLVMQMEQYSYKKEPELNLISALFTLWTTSLKVTWAMVAP